MTSRLHFPISVLALALSLIAPSPRAALAATDGHPAPASPARPAASVVNAASAPATVKAKPGLIDPMDQVRERLAERLGAAKAPETKSPFIVRVVAKVESTTTAGTPAQRQVTHASVLAAEHRAQKVAMPIAPQALDQPAHWSYQGEGGPAQWGALKPDFAKCASGTRQSPIDIRDGIRVDLDPVQFQYRSTGYSVVDNGHTVQVNLGTGNTIEVLGRRYDLVQFHFHRPSEERINGRQFDMVAHLVHKDVEGRLAVVAVLLDRGSAHPLVQAIWNNLPLEKGDEIPARAALDLNQLLPEDRRYFTYMGSLTTPPCSEGVLWMVMAQPVTISAEQLAIFARLYPMNARPTQSVSGRLIKQSN